MIGRSLFHYRVIDEISKGGTGAVYMAEDTKEHRKVALKLLAPEFISDDGVKERFLNDIRAAAALDHPNICRVQMADETPDGQVFVCMDYIEGETLEERLLQGPLFIQETVEIAHEIAVGLSYAHEHGVVHRDVKPANIVMTRQGLVKILDFGQAGLTERRGEEPGESETRSVAYQSPEQLRGEVVDHRTDIWSLGVTIYEMLTGELPFRGQNDRVMSISILNDDPRPVTDIRPDIPQHLSDIVQKCLSKDRGDRYGSLGEFIQQLKILAGGIRMDRALFSKPTSSTPAAGAASTLGRVFWPAATILTALVIIVVIVVWRGLSRDETTVEGEAPIRVAVMPLENRAGDDPGDAFVSGLSETVAETAAELGPYHESMQVVTFPAKTTPALDGRPQAPPDVHRLISGNVDRKGDHYRLTLDVLDAASLEPIETRYVVFSEDSSQVLPTGVMDAVADLLDVSVPLEDRERMAHECDSDPAYDSYLVGLGLLRKAESADELERAIASLAASAAADSSFAPAYAALARTFERAGDRETALRHVAKAIRLGYPPEEFVSDPRLEELRKDPRFKLLVQPPPKR